MTLDPMGTALEKDLDLFDLIDARPTTIEHGNASLHHPPSTTMPTKSSAARSHPPMLFPQLHNHHPTKR